VKGCKKLNARATETRPLPRPHYSGPVAQDYESLLNESVALETEGASIQREREPGMDAGELQRFVDRYQRWYANCLTILPDDLLGAFEDEFKGGWLNDKIKGFLADPLEASPLWSEEAAGLLDYWQRPYSRAFRMPLLTQRQFLLQAQARQPVTTATAEYVAVIDRLCRNLPRFLHPLTRRSRGRSPLVIADEYDLQDVIHGLLRLWFEDVRPEERTPSRGAGSAQMDFLLKAEQIVVETKMTRERLGSKEIADELLIDIGRYRAHPDCKVLIACVYDPSRQIGNPAALESDLSDATAEPVVRVIVVQ
jgi:hypothetical protein